MQSTEPANPFADRLRAHLRSDTVDLPPAPGSHTAVKRAHQRSRNRKSVIAGLAAFGLVAGITGQALRGGTDAEVGTAAQTSEINRGGLAFAWTTADNGLVSTDEPDQVALDGEVLYALSTAPGTRTNDYPEYGSAPQALYRLGDDGSWEPTSFQGDDPFATGVASREGVLYALSTGTATNRDGNPMGSFSTDGGASWDNVPLEAATVPSDMVAWGLNYSLKLATAGDTTLAVVDATVSLPFETMFPELFAEGRPGEYHNLDYTDDGIDVIRMLDQEAEAEGSATASNQPPNTGDVVRTVTWSELGIEGVDDFDRGSWVYAADGSSWTAVSLDLPGAPDDASIHRLESSGAEFLVSASAPTVDEQSLEFHWLGDGTSWRSVTPPAGLTVGDYVLTAKDGTLIATVRRYDDGRHLDEVRMSTDDGVTWTLIDLGSLDPAIAALADDQGVDLSTSVGPLGVAVLITPADGPSAGPYLVFSADLASWSVTDLADIPGAAGRHVNRAVVGRDQVVLSLEDGEVDAGDPARIVTLVGTPTR